MGLMCSCDYEWDGDGWCYYDNSDYMPLPRKKAVRCKSCGEPIKPGALAVAHHRIRAPVSDIEESIHGDEVPLAPHWHCERCADLYASMEALGYCGQPAEDQRNLAREYADMKQRERWAAEDRRMSLSEAPACGCLDAPVAVRPLPDGCGYLDSTGCRYCESSKVCRRLAAIEKVVAADG